MTTLAEDFAASIASAAAIAADERWTTHNYHPLPVVIADGEGAWVTDVDGRRYLDFLSGYSALNFGHRHPSLVAAATAQLGRVTLTSRAFHHDQLGHFCCARKPTAPLVISEDDLDRGIDAIAEVVGAH